MMMCVIIIKNNLDLDTYDGNGQDVADGCKFETKTLNKCQRVYFNLKSYYVSLL